MDTAQETFTFTAFALGGELDLNRLAGALEIARRYRWEEPMRLDPLTMAPCGGTERDQAYLYHFGGVVFLNCGNETITAFLNRLRGYAGIVKGDQNLKYREEYELRIAEAEQAITNDYAVMDRFEQAFIDIICFVIAKSVALERIEAQVETVLDDMEGVVGSLGRGNLNIPDQRLARLASSILSFKYLSIAHIMVLDKPEITWDNPEADRLYLTMATLFELDQRYQEIKHKSETLLDITEVFSGLSHARRAARLEWIIIILIAIEIGLFLVEMLRR